MGVRTSSEARSFAPIVPTYIGPWGARGTPGPRSGHRRSSVPSLTFHFDGTAGKEGLAAALPANEAWMDPTSMVHVGEVEVGLHAMYTGAGTCAVFGAMLPSDYAHRVAGAEGAGLVTEASTKWETIVTLNPNVAANLVTGGKVYTLYRLVFATVSQAGSVVITSV